MNKMIITLVCLLGSISLCLSQQELGLYLQPSLIQSNKLNPAFFTPYKTQIGAPHVNANVGITGASISSILEFDDNQLNINVNNWISALNDYNFVSLGFEINSFDVSHQVTNRIQLMASHTMKTHFYFGYPRELPDLLWNGNGKYIGETVDIGPDFNYRLYSELAVGAAFQIGDKFTLGGKVKYLGGIADISTNSSKAEIFTDDEYYQITVDADYEINYTNSRFDINIDTINSTFASDFSNIGTSYLFGNNGGFGIDLGATYQINDKIQISASIIDLYSGIFWQKDTRSYAAKGSYTFEGIDIKPVISGEETETDFQAVIDTLATIFEFESTPIEYHTKIPTKIYIGGNFNLTRSVTLSALTYGELYENHFNPNFALGANYQLKAFNIGGVYSYRNGRFDNLGINGNVRLGSVVLFATTDNIIPLLKFDLLSGNNMNFRLGLNVALGNREKDS